MSEPFSQWLPFFLHEAVLSLYPLDAEGKTLAAPVWCGAVANGLRLGLEYDELVQAGSGDRYATAHHLDERHTLEIERTWVLRKSALLASGFNGLDAVPGRNQRYALELVWRSGGYWYRRWYWGVTARTAGWDSVRTLQFGQRQSWRAERFTEDGGYVAPATGGGPPVTTPLPDPQEQSVGFFHEAPLLAGAYLLGHYRWPVATRMTAARVVALAPQTSPVVLGLELDGVATGDTLTIPVATANAEVSAEASLAVAVPALAEVRWKVVSAPGVVDSAWGVALGAQVVPV